MSQDTKQNIADNAVRIAIDYGGWRSVQSLINENARVCQADIDYAKQKFPDDEDLISILENSLMDGTFNPAGQSLGIQI